MFYLFILPFLIEKTSFFPVKSVFATDMDFILKIWNFANLKCALLIILAEEWMKKSWPARAGRNQSATCSNTIATIVNVICRVYWNRFSVSLYAVQRNMPEMRRRLYRIASS